MEHKKELSKFTKLLLKACGKDKILFMSIINELENTLENQFDFYRQEIDNNLEELHNQIKENSNIQEWEQEYDKYNIQQNNQKVE